ADGTHTLVVTATDAAGNSSSTTQTIQIDSTAPSTSDSVSGPLGDNGWYTGDVTLTPSASDATSGIATESVTLDGVAQPFGPFVVSGEGTHTVVVTVTDNAGNVTTDTQTIHI